jgi:hypothetical protein
VAGADRMTIEEVVRKVLLDEHADVIREAVKAVAAELMELEVSELIGADHGGGAPTRMTLPVRARPLVTPMRRGRLPAAVVAGRTVSQRTKSSHAPRADRMSRRTWCPCAFRATRRWRPHNAPGSAQSRVPT